MRTRDVAPSVARSCASGALTMAAAVALAACAPSAPTAPVARAGAPTAAATPGPTSAAAPSAPLSTSTPSPAPTPSPTPVAGAPLVVLDPGHNGGNGSHPAEVARPVPDGRGGTKPCNSTGTATDAGYAEHAFNFDVALRTQAILEAAGVRVLLTRPNDTGVGPCVDARGTIGQRSGAAAVVSIHADGAAPTGSGFHVALAAPPLNPAQSGQSHVLGAALHDALRGAGFRESTYLGVHGISLRPDLAGLNLATRPTALVECANMRNAGDAAVVSSPDGRQRYAAAIANGILAFLRG